MNRRCTDPPRGRLAARASLVALFLLLLVITAACGDPGGGETSPPDVTSPTPGSSPEASDTSAEPVPLAQGFPQDFPVYTEATFDTSQRVAGAVFAWWKTPDPAVQVVEFYKEALAQAPWKIISVNEVPEENLVGILITRLDRPETAGIVSIREVVTTSDGQGATSIFVSISPFD